MLKQFFFGKDAFSMKIRNRFLIVCLGILAALHERDRTGVGARVEITMVEASMSIIPDFFTAWTQAGVAMGPESRAAVSLAFCFRCSDQLLLAIHVSSTEKFFRGLLAACNQEAIAEDPRFIDRPSRIRNFHALVDRLRPVFAARPRADWLALLAEQDVPAAAVNSIPEAMADPEVAHLGMFAESTHPLLGRHTMMRRAVRIDTAREAGALPPPALGEHSGELLAALGVLPEELDALEQAGVIGRHRAPPGPGAAGG